MRRLIRFASAASAVALATAPATAVPASAASAASASAAAPVSARQWWFDTWAIESLVWPKTKGAGVTVAVLDGGVETRLPEFRGGVVPGKAFRIGGDGGTDTDDAGEFGHGTGMASLIAARGGRTGFMGVAPEAKIMPLATPGISDSSSPEAIRYAADHGAKIISISLGSTAGSYPHQCPPELLQAVGYAAQKDVIIVAAAGNEGASGNRPSFPGSCPGVVAIGAMDNRGQAWASTQRQDYVTLSAPGVNIAALSQDGRVWPNGNGTSHATALAAGAFALLRSEFPQKSAREIVQLATNTAKDFGPSGKDDRFGYGTLSLRTALTRQVPASAPNPVYERLDAALAQTKKRPAKAGGGDTAAEEGSSGMSPLLLVGGGVVVVGAVALVAFLFLRRGKSAGSRAPAGSAPPPGFGGPAGPNAPGPFAPGAPQPPAPGAAAPQPSYGTGAPSGYGTPQSPQPPMGYGAPPPPQQQQQQPPQGTPPPLT
ncbi:S8 family serine peptidase [Actinomadura sp. 21ATH]|uniref:S8 family serine peptidase n=1 Tax=Actinomadura sp. 21ATH TaxID=1735444 RepID=UPI0035C0DA94